VMPEDENPFENVPDEFSTPESSLPVPPDVASGPINPPDLGELPPIPEHHVDRGRLAMASGFGFVFLAVMFYVAIYMDGRLCTYLFGIVGMVLSALIPLFYMLDDLRIRPKRFTERGSRFLAGILLAFLFLLVFAMAGYYGQDRPVTDGYIRIALLLIVMALTCASFALFFYSMLWED